MDNLTKADITLMLGLVTNEQKAEIEAKVEECCTKIESRFNRTLVRPEIRYDLEGRTAGWAYSENYIRLNKQLLVSDWDEMINQVVPHEVAHIAQFQLTPHCKPHGREWEGFMRILGCPADRTHSLRTIPKRVKSRPYIYRCDCREHKVTITLHRRMNQGSNYTCKFCNGYLSYIRTQS